jgi:hypothetical protein
MSDLTLDEQLSSFLRGGREKEMVGRDMMMMTPREQQRERRWDLCGTWDNSMGYGIWDRQNTSEYFSLLMH